MLKYLLIGLALQLEPTINWKSEVNHTPDGNQVVLTGELAAGIDHVSGTVDYMTCRGDACNMPEDFEFDLTLPAGSSSQSELSSPKSVATLGHVRGWGPRTKSVGGVERSETISEGELPIADEEATNLWALILEAILWGLAMLLTPCVFPMVPMTISFFMKSSESAAKGRFKAAMYGLFIVLLYTVPISAIIGITWIVGGSGVTADIFNWLSTHWLPNILFFLVFMTFAASFFGAFEITMPSKWTNSADRKSDGKGLGGVFFLALTLVLVSFSCTGPIVGTVLIKSTRGEFWTPMATMLAFSIAFALPFTVFALFPTLMKKLPKSGGWLNSVKVILGFIELALGLKFLSTADQTYHWHLLDREIYLAIWIVIFTMMGLYLLGKIRFKNDSPLEYISVKRLVMAIATFTFVVYLIPGMWGAPLKALSGYLPPMETQDFVIEKYTAPVRSSIDVEHRGTEPSEEMPDDRIQIAHGLRAYTNLDDAMAAAEESGKNIFVDITGHGCVNCREMESRVWSDPRVLEKLQNDFEIVALYVDDKTKLPESQWLTTPSGKVLKDVGRVNSFVALERFGVNSQPNYFILSPSGSILSGPRAYNLDIEEYLEFLTL